MAERWRPGQVRDAIIAFLRTRHGKAASASEIAAAVTLALNGVVPASSIRSYLGLNTPAVFVRQRRGYYRLRASR